MSNNQWNADTWLQNSPPVTMDQWPSFVILAPHLANRNILLSRLLQQAQNPYVYTIKPTEHTLMAFLQGMVEGFSDLDARHISQLQQSLGKPLNSDSPCNWADALVADMERLHLSCLVLNDADCLEVSSSAIDFFNHLAESLGTAHKLIINGRMLPTTPWISLVQTRKAVVVGDEKVPGGPIFSESASARLHHIEVYGLAGGLVLTNGAPVTEWDGPLPRNLFFYLIDHNQGVARDDIFEMFWPNLTKKEATNVFHVSKGKISERIGIELTEYRRNFYYPSAEIKLHYDVSQFEAMVKQARMASLADSIACWQEAIRLYRSPFLKSNQLPWVKPRREELQAMYAEGLISIGQFHQANSNADLAISFYVRALGQTPDREDVYRAVIELYAQVGQTEMAIIQYERLVERLKLTWGVAPSPATRTLYERISGQKPN